MSDRNARLGTHERMPCTVRREAPGMPSILGASPATPAGKMADRAPDGPSPLDTVSKPRGTRPYFFLAERSSGMEFVR